MFLDPLPRVIKIKINKSDLIKVKSFCTTKGTKNKTKRLPMEWEKIFANVVTEKGLYSEIYKHLMQQRRQWHLTPLVLLSGKSHGRRSLVGCSPWGR